MKYKELWNDFYRENKYTMWYPGEPAIKFFGRFSKEMSIIGKNGLDLGCGVGRHTKLMDDLGMYGIGIDISEEAIQLGQDNFDGIDLRIYDGKRIPFEDNYFDFVISHGVLDHMFIKDAKELLKEVYRVLKPGGMFELELHSIYDSRARNIKEKEIEKNTIIIEEECEKGLPQHYFTETALVHFIKDFKTIQMILNEETIFGSHKTSFWVVYLEK